MQNSAIRAHNFYNFFQNFFLKIIVLKIFDVLLAGPGRVEIFSNYWRAGPGRAEHKNWRAGPGRNIRPAGHLYSERYVVTWIR